MPAPLLRTDVVAFIAKLRDNPTKAEAIAQAEIDELQARLQPSTLKTYLSWRRTAVLEAFGAKHPAYDMLRLTDEQYRDLNAKYQADVTMRQRHPIRLRHTREMIELGVKLITGRPLGPGADQVDDDAGDDIIDGADDEEAVAAADSAPARPAPALMGNVRNLILGLCLLTGRRPYEIAANPETRFQPIFRLTPKGKVRERFQLEFRGQAKTKGAEASMAHKLNTIPVLADAGLILDAFERLREMIPGTLGMDYETFNRTYAKPLNRRCKQLFGPFWPDGAVVQDERTGTRARGKSKVAATEISVKDLRTVYAEVCSIVFNLTGTVDEMMKPSAYMAKILGHRENDLATAQSYAAIVIEDIVAPGNHPRATGPVHHADGDDAGGAQRQAAQKATPAPAARASEPAAAPATASSRKAQTKKGGQGDDGRSANTHAGVKSDGSDAQYADLKKKIRQQEQIEDQLLALAAGLQVDQLGDGGAQLAVHGGGAGKDQLVVEFDALPGRPWPIASLPKGTPLSEAAARAIVTAWVEGDRLFINDVSKILDAGRPAKAAQKPASSRKKTRADQVAPPATPASTAPSINQLLASLRPEQLDRSARLEQRGNNLVVVFDERPDQPATIAKVPAGLSLSDTQIGDVFHAWQQGGRKTLTAAATKNALEQG